MAKKLGASDKLTVRRERKDPPVEEEQPLEGVSIRQYGTIECRGDEIIARGWQFNGLETGDRSRAPEAMELVLDYLLEQRRSAKQGEIDFTFTPVPEGLHE